MAELLFWYKSYTFFVSLVKYMSGNSNEPDSLTVFTCFCHYLSPRAGGFPIVTLSCFLPFRCCRTSGSVRPLDTTICFWWRYSPVETHSIIGNILSPVNRLLFRCKNRKMWIKRWTYFTEKTDRFDFKAKFPKGTKHFIALYNIVSYCVVLSCNVFHCISKYCNILYYKVSHSITLHRIILYCII